MPKTDQKLVTRRHETAILRTPSPPESVVIARFLRRQRICACFCNGCCRTRTNAGHSGGFCSVLSIRMDCFVRSAAPARQVPWLAHLTAKASKFLRDDVAYNHRLARGSARRSIASALGSLPQVAQPGHLGEHQARVFLAPRIDAAWLIPAFRHSFTLSRRHGLPLRADFND